MKFLRQIGFRREAEIDSTSPHRFFFVIAFVIGFFVLVTLIDGIYKAFK
jgi:hypothetical protein